MDPIAPFIEEKGFLLLDGGLATHLESKGFDLNHKLWSANILLNYPMAIREVHLDYLRAGSDCIITSSYQCSFLGLKEEGLSQQLAEKLLQKSVKLATEARTIFLGEQVKREGQQFLQLNIMPKVERN